MITIVVHISQFGISDKKRPKISCNPFIYYSFEQIIQTLKNYYTTPSKNLGTKLKNRHTTQVYNHQEISKLQK